MVSVTSLHATVLQSWGDWWKWVIRPCSPPGSSPSVLRFFPPHAPYIEAGSISRKGGVMVGRGWTRSPCLASQDTSISARDDLLMGPLEDLKTPGFCRRTGILLHVRTPRIFCPYIRCRQESSFLVNSPLSSISDSGDFYDAGRGLDVNDKHIREELKAGEEVCASLQPLTTASFPASICHSTQVAWTHDSRSPMCSRRHHGERGARTEEKGLLGETDWLTVQCLHQQLSSDVSSLFVASSSVLQKDWICSDTLC